MRENKEVINQCEVILSLACGGGTQAVAEVIDGKKIIPGNDSLFQGEITRITTSGSHFEQKCSLCADCMLGETGGICPVTRCPKGLRNGPCGGAKNRKCEINKGLDCVWITIYKRLTDIGEMRNMYKYKEPRDHTRTKQPQSLDI
jgi:hypothetical protein